MARRRLNQLKVLVLTAGVLVIWLIIPSVVKSFLQASFYEFQAPIWKFVSYGSDLQTYWSLRAHSKDDLIEAGRDLARRNAAHQLTQQENEVLRQEVLALESVLTLPSLPEHKYEVARVIRRDLNAWWQQIVIQKGRDAGIPVGAAVVYKGGVVGRVVTVHASTSVVELVSSRSFRMAANFEDDTRPITYQGRHNTSLGAPWGNVRDVPPDILASSQKPKRLISSRLGGIFPQGLLIGTVTELTPGTSGLFTEGAVALNKDLLSIREVAVLIPIHAEAP